MVPWWRLRRRLHISACPWRRVLPRHHLQQATVPLPMTKATLAQLPPVALEDHQNAGWRVRAAK